MRSEKTCSMVRQRDGKYTVSIKDKSGKVVIEKSGILYKEAVSMIEESMYLGGVAENDG